MKKIVIFGAGKIGRSFIGQLFSRGGYEVVFADVDPAIINALNHHRQYTVVIKSEEGDHSLIIKNARGISALQTDAVILELATADIAAVCVGKMALAKVIPVLANALMHREKITPGRALDLIIAENMRDAADLIIGQLKKLLPQNYPLSQRIGLVETSIGKMVPIMPAELQKKDPLLVYAEPYNQLILDKDAFINPIPEIEGLEPKSPMKAWVDRKSFIHNFGHAALVYYGNLKHPHCRYLYELLANRDAYNFTLNCMRSAAMVLLKMYPDVFKADELEDHIADLLKRFANKALGDTVYRVGMDIGRKLGPDDRIIGVLRQAQQQKLDIDVYCRVAAMAFHFNAVDDNGEKFEADRILMKRVEADGLQALLIKICKFDKKADIDILNLINQYYKEFAENSLTY
ncbi:MAG: hypothetical protein JJU28_14355 [Cyclobacteriaceae bacterium]|nr:hypothetical protein [Cyclobacteriaceae bacterium]